MEYFEVPVGDEQLPAAPTKFWKTVITVTVLTEGEEAPSYDSLSEVAYDIENGEASGSEKTEHEELDAQSMADALIKQGSDPAFLGIHVNDENKVIGVGYGFDEDDEDA